MGDDVLDLGGVLGRGMDRGLSPSSPGTAERGLAFEVEMLLPAHPELAGEAPSAPREIAAAARRGRKL